LHKTAFHKNRSPFWEKIVFNQHFFSRIISIEASFYVRLQDPATLALPIFNFKKQEK
jgi:hypothetical protein